MSGRHGRNAVSRIGRGRASLATTLCVPDCHSQTSEDGTCRDGRYGALDDHLGSQTREERSAYVKPDMGHVGSVQFSEVDKTAVRACETSSVEVERSKVIVEVHMQPLAPCQLRSVTGYLDETNTYSTVPRLGGDHLVLNPRMHKTVPNDVDEADETISISGSDPSEAVLGDERLPIIIQHAVIERISM